MPHRKKSLLFGLLSAITLAVAANAIEVTPANPVPEHSLVRVTYGEGAIVWVLGFRDGTIANVDLVDCGNGTLAFTGAAGTYAVLGMDNGKRFQSVVVISGDDPGPQPPPPPPPPGPDPPPPGRLGLTKAVYDAAVGLPDTDKRLAAMLAANFEWGVTELARLLSAPRATVTCVDGICYRPGGTEDTIMMTVRQAIHDRNVAPTRLMSSNWKPVAIVINTAMGVLRADRKINTPSTYAEALQEIAVALRAL